MKQNQIKFKNLKEDQTIQLLNLNDYFGDGIATMSKPLTKKEFIKKHLQEIIEEEQIDVEEAFSLIQSQGDGDSNQVYITVIDNVAKVVLA